MAIKLSAYLWLRNNFLIPYSEGDYGPGRYLSDEKKQKLKEIVGEIDELHSGSESKRGSFISGQNVAVHIDQEVIERSFNPERSGQLFTEIHEVLRGNFVDTWTYRNLGQAFEELGLEVQDENLKVVIAYATSEFNRRSNGDYSASDSICADSVIRQFKEGKLGKERH